MTDLWYLAYGSNLQPTLLARYLVEPPQARESQWVELDRRLYFAGDSRRWAGPVAFLSLDHRRRAVGVHDLARHRG